MSELEISMTEDSEKYEHSKHVRYDGEKMGNSSPELTTDLVA